MRKARSQPPRPGGRTHQLHAGGVRGRLPFLWADLQVQVSLVSAGSDDAADDIQRLEKDFAAKTLFHGPGYLALVESKKDSVSVLKPLDPQRNRLKTELYIN